jgi:hypothetical protein
LELGELLAAIEAQRLDEARGAWHALARPSSAAS